MNKRMKIIENCEDCQYCARAFLKIEKICYKVFLSDGEQICPKEGIPFWCPLPAVPEYKEYYHEYGQAKDFADGWNSCLDEILAEEETGE